MSTNSDSNQRDSSLTAPSDTPQELAKLAADVAQYITHQRESTGVPLPLSQIHPRKPVILHRHDYDRWLSRDETERPRLDLFRPFESEGMEVVQGGPPVPETRRKGPMAFHSPTPILPGMNES